MNIIDRLRSMMGLGSSTEQLGEATMRRSIVTDDGARTATHGDLSKTTENVVSFSKELDAKARSVG
jgi:hypothetical protein